LYHHGQVHLAGLIETLIMRLMVILGDDHEQSVKYTDPTAAVLADGSYHHGQVHYGKIDGMAAGW
jgi:hypothetical protein